MSVLCRRCKTEKDSSEFPPSLLRQGRTPYCKPCWSEYSSRTKSKPGYREREAEYQRIRYRKFPAKYKVKQVRSNARQRGLSISLTDERIVELASQDCSYCGATAGALLNGIDRVDNRIGYEEGNVVPCCFVCNRAKQDAGREEFIAWAARVVARSKEE